MNECRIVRGLLSPPRRQVWRNTQTKSEKNEQSVVYHIHTCIANYCTLRLIFWLDIGSKGDQGWFSMHNDGRGSMAKIYFLPYFFLLICNFKIEMPNKHQLSDPATNWLTSKMHQGTNKQAFLLFLKRGHTNFFKHKNMVKNKAIF